MYTLILPVHTHTLELTIKTGCLLMKKSIFPPKTVLRNQ